MLSNQPVKIHELLTVGPFNNEDIFEHMILGSIFHDGASDL